MIRARRGSFARRWPEAKMLLERARRLRGVERRVPATARRAIFREELSREPKSKRQASKHEARKTHGEAEHPKRWFASSSHASSALRANPRSRRRWPSRP